MNRWNELPTGQMPPTTITVVVEATKHSRNTYDVNGAYIKLDKILHPKIMYPLDYGYIPKTKWEDGEPMEALVLAEYPTCPGCLVDAHPIGILKTTEKGMTKGMLIVIGAKDPQYPAIDDVEKVQKNILKEVEDFFKEKSASEKITIKIIGWAGAKEAQRAVVHAMKIYDQKKD